MTLQNLLEKLQDLELDNKKIILIALISAMLFYLDFSFVLKSQLQGIKDIGPSISKLESDINSLSKDMAGISDLKNKEVGAKENISQQGRIIISEGYIATLLQNISDIANKNSIKIMQMKPGKELKAKEGSLNTLSLSLDLVCGYHDLGSFINDIEDANELMAIEGIKIESDPMNYMQQRVNLTIRTYVKK